MPHYHDPFSPKAAAKPVMGAAAAPTADAAPQAPAEPNDAQGQQAQAPAANENGVPQGTTTEVAAWVGDDKDRAQQALDAENASGEPRKSLVKKLQDIIG